MEEKRRCRICRKLFHPDRRVRKSQHACHDRRCQRERHRLACEEWRSNNPDYDAEDRFKRKIVQIDEVVGMDVDPMRGIDWSIARDAIGLKPSVIVEETGRLLCSWTRDAISRKHRGNIRESVRLPPGQPRDEMDNRSGGK